MDTVQARVRIGVVTQPNDASRSSDLMTIQVTVQYHSLVIFV